MTAEQRTVVDEKLSDIERLFEAPAEAGEQALKPIPIQIPASSSTDSQLFTVRLWPETVGDDLVEWRGKVDHVAFFLQPLDQPVGRFLVVFNNQYFHL